MRNLLVGIMVAGAVAGCGTLHRSETTYTKPGMTGTRLAADQDACRQQAIGQAETKPLPTWGQTINREAYDDCMRGLGYNVDAASASPRR